MSQTIQPVNAQVIHVGGHVAASSVLTVTAGQYWKASRLAMIWLPWSQAGNRLPKITIADASGNTVNEIQTVTNITLALTGGARYEFMVGASTGTAITPQTNIKFLAYGFPALTMGPGWTITPFDTAAIEPNGDLVDLYLSYGQVDPTII